MENQHRKINTYRELSQEEIDLMNECKEVEKRVAELHEKIASYRESDIQMAKTAQIRLKEGFMWLVRSVAKPDDSWK